MKLRPGDYERDGESGLLVPRRRPGLTPPHQSPAWLAHHGLMMGGLAGLNPNISLLIPGNGVNTGTTFTDVSSYAHAITRTACTTSTTESQWGGSSIRCPSSSSQLLMSSIGSEFQYTADFTIEFWVRFTASGNVYLFDHGGNACAFIVDVGSGSVQIYQSGNVIIGGSTPFNLNQWYFLQLRRSGSSIAVWRDGSSYQSATNSSTLGVGSGAAINVAAYGGGLGNGMTGYMQDIRVSKIAQSTTVPVAAFPTS